MRGNIVKLTAFLLIMAGCFSACADGFDNDDLNSKVVIGKQISRIDEYRFMYNASSRLYTREFQYNEQGFITSWITTNFYNETEMRTLAYKSNRTILLSGAGNFPGPSFSCYGLMGNYGINNAICTFNDDGYIVSMSIDGRLSNDGKSKITVMYSNGYLQKIEGIPVGYGYIGSPPDPLPVGSATETYVWENGNIKSITTVVKHPDSTWEEWPPQTIIFEYGDTPNNPCSLDLGLFLVEQIGGTPYGWFGKSNIYLPTVVRRINTTNYGPSEYVYIYRYETDNEDYVTKIFRRNWYNPDREDLLYTIRY
jgi:hypothetical protein